MSESSGSGGSIGLFGAVFLIFLVLKLVGVEPVGSWSWWWVTSPLWGIPALIIGAMVFGVGSVGFIALLATLVGAVFGRKKVKKK